MSKKKRRKKFLHNGKMVSAQRIWQIKQSQNGNCQRCGKPSDGRVECDACATKYADRRGGAKRQRHIIKRVWDEVDWRLSDREVATQLGVNVSAVYYHRRKNATEPRKSKLSPKLHVQYPGRWLHVGNMWLWSPWATLGMIERLSGRYQVTTYYPTGIFSGGVEKRTSRSSWHPNLHRAKLAFRNRYHKRLTY